MCDKCVKEGKMTKEDSENIKVLMEAFLMLNSIPQEVVTALGIEADKYSDAMETFATVLLGLDDAVKKRNVIDNFVEALNEL